MSERDVVDQFKEAMRAQGLAPKDEIIADGKLHRFAPEGERDKNNHAWYVLHLDHPASGAFGSWKGDSHKWTSNPGRELTSSEKITLKNRMAEDRKAREQETKERHAAAKTRAADLWSKSVPAVSHPYLEKKQIKGIGARTMGDLLVIPVTSQGELVGLQFIPADGQNKTFMKDTPVAGAYCLVGPRPADRLVICEGYATACSIHEATGLPVFAAFNAGNLVPVAQALRERLPEAEILIAADDDRWTTEPIPNPGVHFAAKAAAEVKAQVRRPVFRAGFPGRPTDFNDLQALYGIDEVRTQIIDAKPTFEVEVATGPRHIMVLREPFPHIAGKSGKPLATIENVQEIINRMAVNVRYNMITKNIELIIPNESYSVDNRDNAALSKIMSWASYAGMPTGMVPDYLNYLADQNPYNPVATWVTSKPWDGVKRLGEFFGTVTAKGEIDGRVKALKEILILRWMVSAVAAAFNPNGVSAHGVLVFQGDQYLGKTQWFKRLAPNHLDVIADGVMLRPDDKDSVKQIISKWMVELGELDATFKKSDIAQLKAFITRDRDTLRMPYARRENSYVRRTVFFGSVNPDQFLHDATGNRRFWTIACEHLKHDHTLDMQQVWAEVYELYKQGETWFLNASEMAMLNESNKTFEAKDRLDERLATKLNWDAPRSEWRYLSASDILTELQVVNDAAATRRVGKLIKNFTKGESKIVRGITLHLIPPVILGSGYSEPPPPMSRPDLDLPF